jgi:phosphatidylglycerol:prolipoprotein diacylglycerol transferase
VQFPKALLDADARPETVELVLLQARQINPAWDNLGVIIENVGHSPELRTMLAGELDPRHPSQIYEALLEGAVLFAILWVMRTRFRLPNGVLTGAFFLGYAVLRIIGEFFREPDAPLTGSLTRGQFLSIFLVLIAAGFFLSAWLKPAWPKGKS